MNFKNKFAVSTTGKSGEYLQKCQRERKTACAYFASSFDNAMNRFLEQEPNWKGDPLFQILLETFRNDSVDLKVGSHLSNQEKQDTSYIKQTSLINDLLQSSSNENAPYPKLKGLLKEGKLSDLTIVVDDQEFLSHKSILCARSPYFAAMLQVDQRWRETKDNIITLNDVTPMVFALCLCYMYGIFVDISWDSLSQVYNIVQTADMIGPEDFKYAISFTLQRDFCHFFHKPCPGCVEGVLLALSLSETFNMMDLFDKCLKWSIKHLKRVWPTKTFSQLSDKILKCFMKDVANSMNVNTVINTTLEIDGLAGRLTEVKWARPIIEMASQLMQQCQNVIVECLYILTSSKKIFPLFQGLGINFNIIEDIGQKLMSSLTVENVCSRYVALQKLLIHAETENWNQNLIDIWRPVIDRTWSYLLANYYAIIHTNDWDRMPEDKKIKLKENAICHGDPQRKPRQKPILSSSKRSPFSQNKTQISERKSSRKSSRVFHIRTKSNNPVPLSKSAKSVDVAADARQSLCDLMQTKESPQCVLEDLYEEIHVSPTVFKPFALKHKPYDYAHLTGCACWEV